jgi:hypothetical protein
MLETRVVLLDEVLSAHTGALGADFEGYRNRAYRVAYFCFAPTSTAKLRRRAQASGAGDRSPVKLAAGQEAVAVAK